MFETMCTNFARIASSLYKILKKTQGEELETSYEKELKPLDVLKEKLI